MAALEKEIRLFEGLDTVGISGTLPSDVTGIVCDSRQVRPGNVFVAIAGTRRNGIDFVDDAMARGASAVVSENAPSPSTCWIQVPDARLALAKLSARYCGNPSEKMFVTGITGTNGKTTVAYIMHELLTRAGRETGMIGTVEYRVGNRSIPATRTTPEAPVLQNFLTRMVMAGCDSAILEVSSHALEQKRVAAVDFNVGILTNLTRDHLDYHKTREAYGEAKKILFKSMGLGTRGVINLDDELGSEISGMRGLACELVTFGQSSGADFRIQGMQPASDGSSFTLDVRGRKYELRTNLVGRFNIYNVVAALAGVEAAGVGMEAAMQWISSVPMVPGRLEQVPNDDGAKVLIDYAHTDDALEQVLSALRETTEGKLIVVFGCGGNRDTSKRPAMGEVAGRLADFTIITSDNPRKEKPEEIIAEIEAGIGDASHEVHVSRETAIERALELGVRGDVVLIAGKGHENFQEFANRTVSFDDRRVVERVIAQKQSR